MVKEKISISSVNKINGNFRGVDTYLINNKWMNLSNNHVTFYDNDDMWRLEGYKIFNYNVCDNNLYIYARDNSGVNGCCIYKVWVMNNEFYTEMLYNDAITSSFHFVPSISPPFEFFILDDFVYKFYYDSNHLVIDVWLDYGEHVTSLIKEKICHTTKLKPILIDTKLFLGDDKTVYMLDTETFEYTKWYESDKHISHLMSVNSHVFIITYGLYPLSGVDYISYLSVDEFLNKQFDKLKRINGIPPMCDGADHVYNMLSFGVSDTHMMIKLGKSQFICELRYDLYAVKCLFCN
jgi:hypothetical protein